MIRFFGLELILFLVPSLVYGFYLYFSGIDPMNRESWSRNAVYWLSIAGLLLMIAGFVLIAVSARASGLPLLALTGAGFAESGQLG
jgi:Family of unknown function (DUF6111)